MLDIYKVGGSNQTISYNIYVWMYLIFYYSFELYNDFIVNILIYCDIGVETFNLILNRN